MGSGPSLVQELSVQERFAGQAALARNRRTPQMLPKGQMGGAQRLRAQMLRVSVRSPDYRENACLDRFRQRPPCFDYGGQSGVDGGFPCA